MLDVREAQPEGGQVVTRRMLAVLGELLVTAGVLLALFWCWQTWWTTLAADREAAEMRRDFGDLAGAAPSEVVALRTGPPPVPSTVAPGEILGLLHVPSFSPGSRVIPILEGVDDDVLNRGAAGHYPSTQSVGAVGNAALAGHRRTYGDVFLDLPELRRGDPVVVETATTWYVYEVTRHRVVPPDDTDAIAAVPGGRNKTATKRMLTLTTCHSPTLGSYGSSHRWITYAAFIGWVDRSDGTPPQLAADRERK